MVEEISQKVQTKFIIITHNRMTMSRVDRLYGVTMPEEGVSQIVSVELEEAIKLCRMIMKKIKRSLTLRV